VSADQTMAIDTPTAGSRRSKILLLVLGLVALLAVGVLVWLWSGSDELAPAAAGSEEITVTAAAAESTDEEPSAFDGVVLPTVTYDVFLERDPFDPVVPEPVAVTPTGNDSDGPTDPTDPADPSDPADPTDPSQPGPGDPVSCHGDEELVCDGRVLSLLEFRPGDDGSRIAVIQVDTEVYEVRAGEVFADHYLLHSFDGDCAWILYGDAARRLCQGDRVLK
jgi:hypothetical protein